MRDVAEGLIDTALLLGGNVAMIALAAGLSLWIYNRGGTRRAEYIAAAIFIAVIAALAFLPPAAQMARAAVRWISG